MYEEGGDWYVHKQGHPKFSPKNLENTWFKTTWYTGLPIRHSLQNTIVVCTNERACSLNSVIAALSNMCWHWSHLKQFGLAGNSIVYRNSKLWKIIIWLLCIINCFCLWYSIIWWYRIIFVWKKLWLSIIGFYDDFPSYYDFPSYDDYAS